VSEPQPMKKQLVPTQNWLVGSLFDSSSLV